MNRRLRTFVLATTAVLVTPMLALVAGPAHAVSSTACSGPLPDGDSRFTWTGAGATDRWDNPANWSIEGPAANREPPEERHPTYYGRASTDDSTTGLVCVDPTTPTTILLDGDVHVHVLALEVGPDATLDIETGSRVMVYADPDQYTSVIHDDAAGDPDDTEVRLRGSTLGGPGLIRLEGDLIYGQLGDGAAALDNDHCVDFATGRAVDACAGIDPLVPTGRLQVEDGGVVLVDRRGVNFIDGYRLDVSSGGTLRIAGAGYIAADRDTELAVLDGGLVDLAGDSNVFEGFANEEPDGDLAGFVNEGTVRKSAGTGISSLNVIYSGAGDIDVRFGGLSINGGTPTEASVGSGSRLGTGRCDPGTFDPTEVCTPTTDASDTQLAVIGPDSDADALAIEEGTAFDSAGDIQPAVKVAADDAVEDVPSSLWFQFDDTIPNRPTRRRTSIFHRRPGLQPERVPLCNPRGAIPRAVTSCVVGRRGGADEPTRLKVRTRKPSGLWSSRPSGIDFTRLVSPLVGTRPACQVMHPVAPARFVAPLGIELAEAGPYTVRFAPRQNTRGDGTVVFRGTGHTGLNTARVPIRRTGWIAAVDQHGESSGAFRVVATPTVRFTDRSRHTVAGRNMLIRGRVAPGGRRTVRLFAVRTVHRVGFLHGTASVVRTRPDGRFTVSFRPPTAGRYVLAVRVGGRGDLSTAMSFRAVKVRVKPRPPEPLPSPSVTEPITSSQTTSTSSYGRVTDPLDTFGAFYPGRVATCRFRVRY